MKRIVLLVVFFSFFVMGSFAFAHPPSDIQITFDAKTKMLDAVIIHNTSSVSNHYINKVDVDLNGVGIIEQKISRQDSASSQTVHYLISDVKDGDVLSVEGYCSISGKLKKEITVKL